MTSMTSMTTMTTMTQVANMRFNEILLLQISPLTSHFTNNPAPSYYAPE